MVTLRELDQTILFLDVATHLLKMEEEWPIKYKNQFFDYNNRPTGVPEYNAGVPVPGTYKTNNPQTGIPFTLVESRSWR